MLRLLLCTLLAAGAVELPAATLDAVTRRVAVRAEGGDEHPAVADAERHADSATTAGNFSRSLRADVQLNENFASASAAQDGNVRLAERSFAVLGSAGGTTDTEFDADDFLNECLVEAHGTSELTVTFTLRRKGRLHLHSTLTARGSGNINVVAAEASALVLNTKTAEVAWTSAAVSGPATFDGDITLAAGTYRLVVLADARLGDSGFTPNTGAAQATFAVSGDVAD